MPTPDDARASLEAVLNHLPPTMEASRQVVAQTLGLRMVSQDGRDEGPATQREVLNSLVTTLLVSVVVLESRIERLEGRSGIDARQLAAMMSEFR